MSLFAGMTIGKKSSVLEDNLEFDFGVDTRTRLYGSWALAND